MSTPEEEELIKQVKVSDVLLQTVVTLVTLSGRRLTVEDEKDPAQAKLGIDAARALLPLLPEEEAKPVKDALSQLQMAYVRETQKSQPQPEPEKKPESRIWTPPGSTT